MNRSGSNSRGAIAKTVFHTIGQAHDILVHGWIQRGGQGVRTPP